LIILIILGEQYKLWSAQHVMKWRQWYQTHVMTTELYCSMTAVSQHNITDDITLHSWVKSTDISEEHISTCHLLLDGYSYLLDLLFYPEDEGSTFLRNVGDILPDCMASHSWRRLYTR
jgi:hypothetical protein